MLCPECLGRTHVIDKRVIRQGAESRRRRECMECSHRFTTHETATKDSDARDLLQDMASEIQRFLNGPN